MVFGVVFHKNRGSIKKVVGGGGRGWQLEKNSSRVPLSFYQCLSIGDLYLSRKIPLERERKKKRKRKKKMLGKTR